MNPSFSAEVQKGAIQGAMHPRCNGAKPYIEGCTIVAPISPPEVQTENSERIDPLAHPNVIRITLSERTTAALLACGECFAIVGRDSYPTDPGRMVIYLQPVPLKTICDASAVIAMTHKAVRIRPATTSKSQ
jgi:hypothetical protein